MQTKPTIASLGRLPTSFLVAQMKNDQNGLITMSKVSTGKTTDNNNNNNNKYNFHCISQINSSRSLNVLSRGVKSTGRLFRHNIAIYNIILLQLVALFMFNCQLACFVDAFDENNNQATTINLFVDPQCSWTKEDPPTEAEKFLFILKCDFQPLIRQYFELIPVLEPENPKHLESISDISKMKGVDKSPEADKVRLELINFSQTINNFYNSAMAAINKKEFCTYPTINRFKQLKDYLISGSQLIRDIYDLIAIEYHALCLKDAVTKLPKIPQLVKEVVDIYIDGKDSSLLPDLNRPAGFNDEKKDEFNFDVASAIERNGKLADVMTLVMDFNLNADSSQQVKRFKESCKQFLIDIEEKWQSMEMMSDMLNTEANSIQGLNNFVMRALIPTKYADVCSQLSIAAA